jgi:hypothetical protein
VPKAVGSETPTSPYSSVGSGPRWLIQVDGGEFQLVESETELAELARLGRVTGATPVYTVVDGPRPLGEISDLVTFAPRPLITEPPVRRERRSPERAKLSEELAVLNRPLEDEIEYLDEVPVRRWPKRVAIMLALAAGVLGAYFLVLPRFPNWRSSVTTRLVLPARSWLAGSKPVRATPPQPAALAASAPVESLAAVAATAVEPVRVAPPPAAAPPSDATTPSLAEKSGAPVADGEARKADGPKVGRSHRRHRSGNRAPTR